MSATHLDNDAHLVPPAEEHSDPGPGGYFVPRSKDPAENQPPARRASKYRDRFRKPGTKRWPR